MEVLALIVPTFTFGDVIVAVLPARGVGLSKILGLPMDGSKFDPTQLPVGRCQELMLDTIFALEDPTRIWLQVPSTDRKLVREQPTEQL